MTDDGGFVQKRIPQWMPVQVYFSQLWTAHGACFQRPVADLCRYFFVSVAKVLLMHRSECLGPTVWGDAAKSNQPPRSQLTGLCLFVLGVGVHLGRDREYPIPFFPLFSFSPFFFLFFFFLFLFSLSIFFFDFLARFPFFSFLFSFFYACARRQA